MTATTSLLMLPAYSAVPVVCNQRAFSRLESTFGAPRLARSRRCVTQAAWIADGAAETGSLRTALDALLTPGRVAAGLLAESTSDSPARSVPQDLEQLSQTAAAWSDRGQLLEYQVFESVTALLPPDQVTSLVGQLPAELRQLLPRPPAQNAAAAIDVYARPAASAFALPVALATEESPAALLANQLVAELDGLKTAVSRVNEMARELLAATNPADAPLLKLNLREGRDILERRLQQLSEKCSDGIGRDAASEATMLLVELDSLL